MKKLAILSFSIVLLTNFALAGARDLFQPLSLDDALKQAEQNNKPVLAKFDATWCGWCRAMDVQTFSNKEVQASLQDYITIKVDVDTDAGKAIAQRYGVRGTPYIAIFQPDGSLSYSQPGFQGPKDFLTTLKELE